jgi:hypothetical protein
MYNLLGVIEELKNHTFVIFKVKTLIVIYRNKDKLFVIASVNPGWKLNGQFN